jgi:eukaryotic-like serine/threonine-protein kinase
MIKHLGKHILLQKLAEGGMGEVYLAKKVGALGITKFVALKTIASEHQKNAHFFAGFLQQEASVIINLSHQNIVNVFEFGYDQGYYFIAMEYVPGANIRRLSERMQKKGVSLGLDHILHIIRQVASGLHAAHQLRNLATGQLLGLVHCDISPQNIMVGHSGEVKIIDFGIARQARTQEPLVGWGKGGYMSPEQARSGGLDQRTDIYSLGVVLWELLMGPEIDALLGPPDKRRVSSFEDTLKQKGGVPEELIAIVNKATAQDREARYPTASHMEMALTRALTKFYPDFSAPEYALFFEMVFKEQILVQRRMFKKYYAEADSIPVETGATKEDATTIVVLDEKKPTG